MNKIIIIRGDDYTMPITIKHADWTAYNLKGCVLFFTVKEKNKIATDNDDKYVIAKDITTHVNEGLGETALILESKDTKQLSGVYVYDLKIKTLWGEFHSTQRGEFEIKENVTKRTV